MKLECEKGEGASQAVVSYHELPEAHSRKNLGGVVAYTAASLGQEGIQRKFEVFNGAGPTPKKIPEEGALSGAHLPSRDEEWETRSLSNGEEEK